MGVTFKKNKMKVYEVILDEENINSGVNAISLVNSPAMELDFITLSKNEEQKAINIKLADEDRHILMGAVLIPNKPIYRKLESEEFYILFSKETIRRASELYFMRNNHLKSTLEHNQSIKGITTVESWIVEDAEMDKSKMYGFSVPLGTWMVSQKVENEEAWQLAKSGELKGFSIEGYFMPEFREQLNNLTKAGPIDDYEAKLESVQELLKQIYE